ncbi:MAG: CatA-like O-acetyltransferase [Bacteroidota bacterium]
MIKIDLQTWNRKSLYEHFIKFTDPYFGVTVPIDVTKTYQISKKNDVSLFGLYLHACMKAINEVEAFKLRIVDNEPVQFETIHASPTIARKDKTFGFSFIEFSPELEVFLANLQGEKDRIENSEELFPPVNGLDCVHCSALPWLPFSGHKEPASGFMDSIPKLAFNGVETVGANKIQMNVAINVNHALVDGYHVHLFCKKFQHYLDS